jgi:hypothetical protein
MGTHLYHHQHLLDVRGGLGREDLIQVMECLNCPVSAAAGDSSLNGWCGLERVVSRIRATAQAKKIDACISGRTGHIKCRPCPVAFPRSQTYIEVPPSLGLNVIQTEEAQGLQVISACKPLIPKPPATWQLPYGNGK